MKKTILSALLVALVTPAWAQDAKAPPQDAGKPKGEKLRVVAIPDASFVKDDQDKIGKWLAGRIGVEVEFTSVQNYGAAVTALATGKADLGWLGGVTTVQVMQQSKGKVLPIVTTDNNLRFKSYVIARADLKATKLEDLKGKSFTFGAKTSTSGHIMARHCLEQAGVDPEKFFAKVAYSGDHTKTAMDVQGGEVDCGVLNYVNFDRMVADKKVDAEKVKIVWTTPEYVDYAWNARADVDERCGKGTTDKIKAAFLSIDPKKPEDAAVLKIHGGKDSKGYVAVQPKQWDGIKAVLDKVDISK